MATILGEPGNKPRTGAWKQYRLRWKRRELLWRSIRAFRRMSPITDRTAGIAKNDILLFAIVRNEANRLSAFLAHYRKIGVGHFLIVDNGSSDDTVSVLAGQRDVSLWCCRDDYRLARFGMDWAGALLMRYGHRHWCVTVDADELFIYPECDSRDLHDLTAKMDTQGAIGMGALMLDLYPAGPLGQAEGADAAGPSWFDPYPYRTRIVQPMRNRIVQGGVRDRVFFPDHPERSPTLNKLPLIRWHWRYTYVNSTHSMLPPRLNDLYDGPGDPRLTGVLLHSKFSEDIVTKTKEDLVQRRHFKRPEEFVDYYNSVISAPVLRFDASLRYRDWQQLVDLGLMSAG